MNFDAALKITANVVGENNIRKLGNSMQGLEGKIKNAGLASNILYTGLKGLAAVAVTGGVVALAKSAIDLADDLRDLSQRTGVGIETLGQFKVAAELSGTSLDGVATGLKFLNKNMVAAATGTKDAAAAFKTIGVATTEADGSLRKADKVFLDIADKFQGLRDGPEKAALAIKVFGKAGTDLIPILNLGSKEIQRFGLGIGPDFANKADAFNDSLGIMQAQTTVLTVQIGSALLPVLSGLVNIVGQAITFVGNLAVEFYNAIGGAAGLNQIAATLIKTMVVLGAVTAGVFVATNLSTFASVLRGVVGVMRTMLTLERAMLAIETARVAVVGLIAGVKSGKTPASAIIGGAAGGLLAGGALMLGLGKLIDGIIKQIGNGLGKAFTMPNIPDAVLGTTPDLRGLDTSKLKAPKTPKIKEDISPAMLTLEKQLLQAQKESNQIQEADIKLQIEYLKYEEEKTKTRKGLLEVLKAEKTFTEEIGEIGTKAGQDAAADLIKRMELQERYNTTIEDLRVKAGLVTGEELKQLNINREIKQILDSLPDATQAMIDKVTELVTAAANLKKSFDQAFGEAFQDGIKSMGELGTNLGSAFASAFSGMADQLTEFVTTGKASFGDFARSVLQDLTNILIKFALFSALKALVPGGSAFGKFLGFANGAAFAQNGIQPFARGGIVDRPTLFPFAKGTGLMGEAGPEAIMPLRRGRDGRLGVEAASGGGTTNVVVNVDASGSSQMAGNPGQGAQLGRVIAGAVQQELVRQKRPGGLLA